MARTARVQIQFRISGPGLEWVQKVADDAGVDRSTVLRGCVALASQQQQALVKLLVKTQEDQL